MVEVASSFSAARPSANQLPLWLEASYVSSSSSSGGISSGGWRGGFGGAVGWAEDPRGELYFVAEGSEIYRLDPQP